MTDRLAAIGLLAAVALVLGCPGAADEVADDDSSGSADDDDDSTAGDDDTTSSPLAPCTFGDLSAGRILVDERYAYDPYGDWSWAGAIDAWIWPRAWSRNHGIGVFHWVEAEEGDCRLLGLDPGGCGEPCGPGELCGASGDCEPVWLEGADAGILTVESAGDESWSVEVEGDLLDGGSTVGQVEARFVGERCEVPMEDGVE